jgi:hypothetical protein
VKGSIRWLVKNATVGMAGSWWPSVNTSCGETLNRLRLWFRKRHDVVPLLRHILPPQSLPCHSVTPISSAVSSAPCPSWISAPRSSSMYSARAQRVHQRHVAQVDVCRLHRRIQRVVRHATPQRVAITLQCLIEVCISYGDGGWRCRGAVLLGGVLETGLLESIVAVISNLIWACTQALARFSHLAFEYEDGTGHQTLP